MSVSVMAIASSRDRQCASALFSLHRSSPRKRGPGLCGVSMPGSWVPACARTSGDWAMHEHICYAHTCYACDVERVALSQKKITPCFGFGPGDRPHSSYLASLSSRGMARRQGARPGSPGRRWHGLRPGPGRETSRPAPCGAPTRHLRLTPQSAIGPHQELYVPGGLVPRPPVGQACVVACPQVPLPVPALKTPHENALDDGSG